MYIQCIYNVHTWHCTYMYILLHDALPMVPGWWWDGGMVGWWGWVWITAGSWWDPWRSGSWGARGREGSIGEFIVVPMARPHGGIPWQIHENWWKSMQIAKVSIMKLMQNPWKSMKILMVSSPKSYKNHKIPWKSNGIHHENDTEFMNFNQNINYTHHKNCTKISKIKDMNRRFRGVIDGRVQGPDP